MVCVIPAFCFCSSSSSTCFCVVIWKSIDAMTFLGLSALCADCRLFMDLEGFVSFYFCVFDDLRGISSSQQSETQTLSVILIPPYIYFSCFTSPPQYTETDGLPSQTSC